jgi:hypothetical protein
MASLFVPLPPTWASVQDCHPRPVSLRIAVGLIRNDALVQALIEVGVVPASTTNVAINTTGEGDGFVRMSYHHIEDGEPAPTTTRVIDAHAQGLDRIDWVSPLSEPDAD